MSELKAYIAPTADGTGLAEYYIKSEADKVIAYHKYKRCLAMAKWCEAEAQNCLTQQRALICFPNTDRLQYLQVHFLHFSRWHRRWMKLAEKLKEAK